MKKWFILGLVICFIFVSIIGCGSEKTTTDKGADSEGNDGVKQGDPIKISMTLMGGPKTEGTWMEEEMEKRLNVEFDFIMLPGWDDVNTKINLLMSDPDAMPDVIWWSGMEKEFQQWINAGLIVDMMPYLKEHGNNILGYYTPETLYYSFQDGKMYKLPGDVAEPSCMTTMIRKDWLDTLGLDVPKTLDQYIEVLRAFTHDDPDQNGQNDTYGFSGAAREWRSFAPFLYPFKAQPGHFVITEDGTIKHGSVMPEMKEALKVLADAFKEGLIDPTMLTSNDFEELMVNGVFGSAYRWVAYFNPSNTSVKSFKANNPDGEYIYIDAIKGPDGFSADEPEDLGGWCFISITSAAEDPEAVFKVLDQMASAEFFKFRKWGIEGEHYELEDGVLNNLVSAEDAPALGLNLTEWFFNRKDEANIENSPEVIELFNRRAETSQPLREIRVRFKEQVRPMWAEYGADIESLRDKIFYGIIAGDYSIDEFDKYVEKFYQMGGQEVEDEANEFYKKQVAEYNSFMEIYNKDLRR
jgi:ABC-type glycerol-3-phosphate transport system substrate-binding protein